MFLSSNAVVTNYLSLQTNPYKAPWLLDDNLTYFLFLLYFFPQVGPDHTQVWFRVCQINVIEVWMLNLNDTEIVPNLEKQ